MSSRESTPVGGGADPGERGAPTLLLLLDGDDVLVATRDLEPGAYATSTGGEIVVTEPVQLGHKVAARAITAGTRIVRCGVPIGSATDHIEEGAWVHTHNLASDYVATFAHRGGQR